MYTLNLAKGPTWVSLGRCRASEVDFDLAAKFTGSLVFPYYCSCCCRCCPLQNLPKKLLLLLSMSTFSVKVSLHVWSEVSNQLELDERGWSYAATGKVIFVFVFVVVDIVVVCVVSLWYPRPIHCAHSIQLKTLTMLVFVAIEGNVIVVVVVIVFFVFSVAKARSLCSGRLVVFLLVPVSED